MRHRHPGRRVIGATNGGEHGMTRLPPEGVCQAAGRRGESEHVLRDVFALQHELSVLACRVPPLADADVQLAVVFVGAIVPRIHQQSGRGVEVRRVAHGEHVGAVAERASEDQGRAGPSAVALGEQQVQMPVAVDPHVPGIAVVVAVPVDRHLHDLPLIAAERHRPGRRRCPRPRALDRRHRDDASAGLRERISRDRRAIVGFDEERGVLRSEVDRVFPGQVPFDRRKRPASERLHPPGAAPGEQHDALIRMGASHASRHRRELVWTTGVGRRHRGEFDGGFRIRGAREARRQKTGKQTRS